MRLMRDTEITPFLNEPFVRPLGRVDASLQRLMNDDRILSGP